MQHEQTIPKDRAGTRPLQPGYPGLIELASHDLQAPLRKLAVFTERLINKYISLPDEEAGQYINRINSCISQMRSLIDDLAGFSRTTPDTMAYTQCDLGQMIRKLTEELVSGTEKDQVVIRMRQLPVLTADKSQLELMFRKILENSFRFRKPVSRWRSK
jgi:light-regulated signal transduction histidine kinase (bacteriophytochrome)